MKFSFVIPIYNGEKYIDICLNSLLNQTYENYEIIIINDGSTDKSVEILEKYSRDYNQIHIYNNKEKGVSSARNYGVSKINGDYFIFVDVDDYIDLSMLEIINQTLKNQRIDLIRYNYSKVTNQKLTSNNESGYIEILNGEEAALKFIDSKIPFDLTCIYVYNTKFWKENKFSFELNRYHEDFGLIPYVIMKSKNVLILDKTLYYYVQSDNSITRGSDYEKTVKKFNDTLYHFDNLYEKINQDKKIKESSKKIFNSYIANAVLLRYKTLNKIDKKAYKKILENKRIIDLLLDNNFLRKIKKIIYKIML